jgi:hypothetical protein
VKFKKCRRSMASFLPLRIVMPEEVLQFKNECSLNPTFSRLILSRPRELFQRGLTHPPCPQSARGLCHGACAPTLQTSTPGRTKLMLAANPISTGRRDKRTQLQGGSADIRDRWFTFSMRDAIVTCTIRIWFWTFRGAVQ